MKSFSTKNGDVVIGKTIEIVEGAELLRQKVERILGTNQGEWEYDTEEGIDFSVIFRKNYDKQEIRTTIEQALIRIDSTFIITKFDVATKGREATITLQAVNSNGVEVGGVYKYD
ncbi:MAG: DUF2634 domain-containing protein [Paludibacteraceae bacterium]|nr:DUF2634 domain-containing protein [Paludibacteraceae bacterium]